MHLKQLRLMSTSGHNALENNSELTRSIFRSETLGEALGKVPIVRLQKIHPSCSRHAVYAKLESCNPGGSIKEKNAAYLISKAEKDGILKPGGTIVESSSGNFGIGLAMMGAAKGYRVIIVVDAKTPLPMRRMLRAFGAELYDVPLSEADAQGSMQVARMRKARELGSTIKGAWYVCQHLNPDNPTAHYEGTAREILSAFDAPPDVVVIGVSTAGQIAGMGRYFREHSPQTQIVGVDVAGSAIFGTSRHPYKMTGLGLSFVPPNFSPEHVDAAFTVDDQLAFSMCRELARKEGLFLGASTGAIVAAASAYLNSQPRGRTAVVVAPDRGDRYLETVYNDEWLEDQDIELLRGQDLEDHVDSLRKIPMEMLKKGESQDVFSR